MKIAIIGSSPSLFDKPRGDEIDSHDLVIRCNWGLFNINKKYTGSHTDIWVLNLNGKLFNKYLLLENNICEIWSSVKPHNKSKEKIRDVLKDNSYFFLEVDNNIFNNGKKIIGKDPTTGFYTILFTIQQYPNAEINLYGFSQNKKDNKNTFTSAIVKFKHHNLNNEREYITNLDKVNRK